ncbi:MAG TPA: SDR family NAD(P)-dependent oxidoreductase [Acidobacteriaceae bacterium]|jgi:short-subunit dehydrogenase|nr:SDR family NAD(P)-dependent oxidoreductase [Acidobacteriaceae bacterium]
MHRGKAVLLGGAAMAATGVVCAGTAAAMLVRRQFRPRSLQGQVVLITGASRGLGLAMAEAFGRRGAKLAIVARDPWELDRARALLVQRGAAREAEVLVIPADLRKRDEAEQAVAKATAHFGRIDVLVNNAGVITVGPVENQTAQDFHDVMESNFFTGLHCALAVTPQMLARRSGTIVNIASIGGKVAVPHLLPYSASKFAVVGFSEGLHAELRQKGVHVLTVCPGLMRTGSHLAALFSGDKEREYRWFSLAANLPGVSTSAACAARRIVRAVQCRETEIAITPQAVVATRLAQLAPEIVVRAMSVANRLLPGASSGQGRPQRGAEVRGRDLLPVRTLGESAARRYNQSS